MRGEARASVQGKPAALPQARSVFPAVGPRVRALALCALLAPILLAAGIIARDRTPVFAELRVELAVALGALGWFTALALARRAADRAALLAWIAAGAIALRVVFLAAEPELSDDVHRYVW